MALIKCPECNHQVSSFADSCPNCGYPIALARAAQANGEVTIELPKFIEPSGNQSKADVVISHEGRTLWKGCSGKTATIYVHGPITVDIKYIYIITQYTLSGQIRIDRTQSDHYKVSKHNEHLR